MTVLKSLTSLLLTSSITLANIANLADALDLQINLDETSHSIDVGEALFLTPYLENGDIETARSLSRVGELPNALHCFPSYSGFFTVNRTYDSNMFFWFFPALNNDTKAPIILWLQGGPGGSGFVGLFVEIGPYVVRENMTLDLRSETWAREFNVLFVDNPVGTGFSFTNSDDGYSTNEDEVADNLYEFLQQFFEVYDDYASNDLYVAGESYGGKYVPAIGYKIHTAGPPAQTNFKGIAIGNGLCDPEKQMNYSDYYYQLGIVDRKQAAVIQKASDKAVEDIKNGNYVAAFYQLNNIVEDVPQVADPNYLLQFAGYHYTLNLLRTEAPGDVSYYEKYVELSQFRRATHVGNLTFHGGSLEGDGKVRQFLIEDYMQSIKPKLVTLMDNYQVLIYNGQLDLSLPYVLMENFLNGLEWKSGDEYRKVDREIWRLQGSGEVAGYVHHVEGFNQLLVRSAGHLVPYDQPQFALDMITRFIKGISYA